jgi:endonuclease YncB( thermonuclease family)
MGGTRTSFLGSLALAVCAAALGLAVLPVHAQSVAKGACLPQNAFTAFVKSVSDGRSLVLDDGREILLAAIEAPGSRARDALPALVTGRALAVDPLTAATDRYGRIPARAFLAVEGTTRPLEAELIASGVAVVGISNAGVRNGADPCRPALLLAEAKARTARQGLWGDPDYDTKAADTPAVILGSKGRFAVIEGKVLSVRESGGTIYFNFGRRWSEDFTVTILKRIGARFVAAGLDPKRLEGRRVRVRGFVEERGGPWIEATAPEQFEIADSR